MHHNDLSRRKFMAGTLAGLAAAGAPEWFLNEEAAALAAQTPKQFGPNDQINLGLIGAGGSKGGFRQGLGDTRNLARVAGVKVVAVCDVETVHREEAAAAFGPETSKHVDYPELLARPDLDAVVIGTPDHWHGVIAVAAMKAGKSVYCEKPLTLFIDEGKEIVKTQAATGQTFQTGSQQRSDARFRLACELVRNGRIGKIQRVVAHLPAGNTGGPFPIQPVPDGLEWDRWLGPAPMTEYLKERTHGSFRHWLEYSGGMMTDWGAHHLDITQWGLGMDKSGPLTIAATGTRPQPDPRSYNAFTAFEVTYTYAGDITVVASNQGENGVDFFGSDGQVFVSRGRIAASKDEILRDPLPDNAVRLYNSSNHAANFIECIRSRKDCICSAEIGHRSVSVCHLGNLALQAGRKLQWDPAKEQFINDADANAMIRREMRKPYSLWA